MNNPVYNLRGIGRKFVTANQELTILHKIDMHIRSGETIAIHGASGSGKSTLLHIMGGLDKPSWGEANFSGKELSALNPDQLASIREKEIGFVFQFHHLLPEFNALENAGMPAIISGLSPRKAQDKAYRALEKVGLKERSDHAVTTLSGGERQRVAIARAILMEPRVILADEPTGNLDEKTGKGIADLLLELNETLKTTLVLVTHNHELAASMQSRYEIHLGELHALD